MPERTARTIDHVVHAVHDLDEAAKAYGDLGFTVTPRADHPFGTSNRLVVLEDAYIEIVGVTDPTAIPDSGFAARVTSHLRRRGAGITHVVLSSYDPPADLAALGSLATGEIFNFSRPAPQPDGSEIKASFECTLARGTDDLGMFLCRHVIPEAVWNESTRWHPNRARRIDSMALPVESATLDMLGTMAGAVAIDETLTLGKTTVTTGAPAIRFDSALPTREIGHVLVGGGHD